MSVYDKSQPVMSDVSLESEEKSQLIGTSSVNVQFSQNVIAIEIANNSEDSTIYLNIAGGIATLSSGIPIYAKGFYSAEKKILKDVGISLISDKLNTDVRIIGHFNFQSELA
jgi:hypothetical protein